MLRSSSEMMFAFYWYQAERRISRNITGCVSGWISRRCESYFFPITSAVPMATGCLWVVGETDINNVSFFQFLWRFQNSTSLDGYTWLNIYWKEEYWKESFLMNKPDWRYNACMHALTHFSSFFFRILFSFQWTSMRTSICWIYLQWIGLTAYPLVIGSCKYCQWCNIARELGETYVL